MQTTGPCRKSSAKDLTEVLSFARRALANVYNIHRSDTTGNNLITIEELRRENELLKKELSGLEKIMKEKL